MGDFKIFLRYLVKLYLPITFFIVTLIGISFSLHFPKITDNELRNTYFNEIHEYNWIKKINKIDGIILGSSTLRYGLSCNILSSAEYQQWVNMSMDARDPIMFYLLLQEYIKQINPKIILIGLDPWIYSKSYYKYRDKIMLKDLNYLERFHYFMDINKQLPLNLYKEFFSTRKVQQQNTKISLVPEDFGSVELKRTAVNFNEINEDFFKIKKTGWSSLQYEYLEKVKKLCNNNKIEVIFVVSPKRNDYIKVVHNKFNIEHNQWWSKITKILKDEKVIGTYDCLKEYNQDSIFAEAYHLNSSGQKLFSKYLKKNINNARKITMNFDFINSKR